MFLSRLAKSLRIVFTVILLSVISSFELSAYEIYEGYIISPAKTSYGVVFTDEYESTVYITKDGKTEMLFSSPGCGRYLSFSADGSKIGYKYINPVTGLQRIAYYDLNKKQVVYLTPEYPEVGQLVFGKTGAMYYTLGNKLLINDGSENVLSDLGAFSNRVYVSPDETSVVYKDTRGSLWSLNLNNHETEKVTTDDAGYGNVAWSPDGDYIAYESVDANIYLYSVEDKEQIKIAYGEEPRWSPDGSSIVFYAKDIDFNNYKLLNSDIFSYSLTNKNVVNLTNTTDRFETHPSFSSDNEIIFATYKDREIVTRSLTLEASESEVINYDDALKVNFFKEYQSYKPTATEDVPDYVHIHQVYDTRDDWDQGRVCCGATAAMEAIASYEIVEPNPIWTYSHNSDFGIYVSNPYTMEGYTFNGYSGRWGSGGHGYLWNTSSPYGSSPYSNTVSYLQKHGITATKQESLAWWRVQYELDQDYPYILCSTGLTSGHIVLAVGQYGAGHTIYANDPYGDKNYGSYGYVRNGKNAIYDWSDANTGHIKVTPVVWAVTAHYQYRLKLKDNYPKDGQNEISCSVGMVFNFDTPVDAATLDGNITLVDKDDNLVDIYIHEDKLSEGNLHIDPVSELNPEETYKVIIRTGLQNTDGNPLKKDIELTFETERDVFLDGNIIEDFETPLSWDGPNISGYSTQVNPDSTYLEFVDYKKNNGEQSAKLRYIFMSSSNSEATVTIPDRPYVAASTDSSFAISVYGDLSNNLLKYWFWNDNAGPVVTVDTINWSGWKTKFISLEDLSYSGNLRFHGISVKRLSGGAADSEIFFDDIMAGVTPTLVDKFTPADEEEEVEVTSQLYFRFNKAMNKTSVENALILSPSVALNYAWAPDNKSVIITPAADLTGRTVYEVTLSEDAEDTDGVKLYSTYKAWFKTRRIELSLDGFYPGINQADISQTVEIRLQFDGPINKSTLSGKIKLLHPDGSNVSVKVNTGVYEDGFIIFEPQQPLDLGQTYTVELTNGIADMNGLLLNNDYTIPFTTTKTQLVSGNVIETFEDEALWTEPITNSFTQGVNTTATDFKLSSVRELSGSYCGQLDYEFTEEDGICVLAPVNSYNVGSDDDSEVGLWIFGDLSNNIVEYWFTVQGGSTAKVVADTIDWTGWKLISVKLGNFDAGKAKVFNAVVVKKNTTGRASGTIYLEDLQSDVLTDLDLEEFATPVEFALDQNYPNPFNPTTFIRFGLPESANVKLEVFNILGQKVATLINRNMEAGYHKIEFNASHYSSGVYIYRIDAGKYTAIKKMLMVK